MSLLLFVAGLLAGIAAAVAGGASLFSFPALLYVGLPPIVANATNYFGLLPANAAALPAFWSEIKRFDRSMWPIFLMVAVGGLTGSLLLLATDERIFRRMIPLLLLTATVIYAAGPTIRAYLVSGSKRRSAVGTAISFALLLCFSIYGGYFGAGVGFMVLACLALLGYEDPLKANALKNVLMVLQSVIGATIFGFGTEIAWGAALTVAVGATAGGYLGGRIAHLLPAAATRTVIILTGAVVTIVSFTQL